MPRYQDNAFQHSQQDKIGVLITNLGSPAAATPKALRPYLKQFLSDPRVVEFPRLLWWLILNGIILRVRPRKSAKAYASIWSEEGAPLAQHTKAQASALNTKLQATWGDSIIVDWAMRYGQPSISHTLQNLLEKGVKKVLLLPLYPQYSASTTASTFDALAADFLKRRWIPELRFVTQYFEEEAYIETLANSVRQHWQAHSRPDKLLFSYHGVPLRYLHQGDPYHCQCHKTTRLVAEKLGLNEDEYMTVFQSRFGKEAWLQPYTDETLISLAKTGTNHVQVICPGFSSDCLETLEEIDVENRTYFLTNGGKQFGYIPCLNSSEAHIDCLTQIVSKHLQGWTIDTEDSELRTQRAKQHPYNQA